MVAAIILRFAAELICFSPRRPLSPEIFATISLKAVAMSVAVLEASRGRSVELYANEL
jgi:hypothetical protein